MLKSFIQHPTFFYFMTVVFNTQVVLICEDYIIEQMCKIDKHLFIFCNNPKANGKILFIFAEGNSVTVTSGLA